MNLIGIWRIAYVDYLAGDDMGRHPVDWCRKQLRENLPESEQRYPIPATDSLYRFSADGFLYVTLQCLGGIPSEIKERIENGTATVRGTEVLLDRRAWFEENGIFTYDSPFLHDPELGFLDLTDVKTLRFEDGRLLINNLFSQLVLEKVSENG